MGDSLQNGKGAVLGAGPDPKEVKVRSVALSYYSRKDVQKAIFDF